MSQVAIQKVNDANRPSQPVFEEIAKRFDAIRQRAFELFEKRGGEAGRDQEDWLEAERQLFGNQAAELAEKDGTYEVKISLAGFEPKDVEVTATPTEVIVHAATKAEKKTKKDDALWTEFDSNELYRRFDVPNPINPDKVTANLEDGILVVLAPKAGEAAKLKGTKVVAA